MKNNVSLRVAIVVALLAAVSGASGRVIRVPGDYSTIQGAFNAAWVNDTILVAPGTYVENVTWPGLQGIVLLSEAGPDVTIIDGDSLDHVIAMSPFVDTTTLVSGFTIRNGAAEFGAGISCENSSSPKIHNCRLISNHAVGSGGGINCLSDASPVIEGCMIDSNTAGGGGGVYCHAASFILRNSSISNNSASSGGGIIINDASATIENCTITANAARDFGGGIHFVGYSFPFMTGNTISENQATTGSGIYIGAAWDPYPPISYNNIQGHSGYAMYNNHTSYRTIARYNWWGHATGPYHPSLNPGGLGDTVGDYIRFIPWLTEPVGVQEIREARNEVQPTALLQNRPNPFSQTTHISYRVASNAKVSLRVYDAAGRLVKTLVDKAKEPGCYSVVWDGRDGIGRSVAAGIYFYQIETDDIVASRKMLVLR